VAPSRAETSKMVCQSASRPVKQVLSWSTPALDDSEKPAIRHQKQLHLTE